MKKFTLDYEVVDGITRGNLIDVRDNLQADIEAYANTGKDAMGHYIHPEDAITNLEYLTAVKKVLKYFGENS
jgi:hypothetical protein